MATVLIVDDDGPTGDHFAQMLRISGYETVIAQEPLAALDLAATTPFDALILDLRMPLMDGATLLGRLRAIDHLKHVPAVVVTGDYLVDDEICHQLRELGAEIRYKPLWIEDILVIVNTLIRRAPAGRGELLHYEHPR